ncbi:MAG TPA: S16 family serine protease [Phycisphaerae bacterium]|jgi:hypothetical protein
MKRSPASCAALAAAVFGLLGSALYAVGPIGRGGVVGGGAPAATAPSLNSRPVPLNLGPAITVPAPGSFPAETADSIDRADFQNKAHPVSKSVASATAMMIQMAPDGSEIGITSDVIANVAAGSRVDPLEDVLQSLLSIALEPDAVKNHPELKNLPSTLKGKPASARADVKRLANTLMSDAALLRTHPEIRDFRPKLTDVTAQAVFVSKQAKVGQEMQTSFDEAVRAVQVRYPTWEPARIEFSFGDKYTPHDGGSAGTCFAVLLLSELEGFEVDPKCAVTGDITVNWKVKKIGGLPEKLRGAAASHCVIASVPNDNSDDLADMALVYGDVSLKDIQIFGTDNLQDALRLMKKDRPPRLAAAIKAFNDLQPRLKLGKPALEDKDNQKSLEAILALEPNHLSAKWLLAIGRGTAPKTLSTLYALEQIMVAINPYKGIVIGLQPATRETVTATMTTTARKELMTLSPLVPKELQSLLVDARSVVEMSSQVASNQTRPNILDEKCNTFLEHLKAAATNKEMIEKAFRGQ